MTMNERLNEYEKRIDVILSNKLTDLGIVSGTREAIIAEIFFNFGATKVIEMWIEELQDEIDVA